MKNFKFKWLLLSIVLSIASINTAWGNTTHPVYCAINSSSLGTGTLKINVHKGTTSDGGQWYRTTMEKIGTSIHKASTGETKDLYYGQVEYVEEGLQEIQFEIWDGETKREWHSAFTSWWTSPGYTKPIYDYENKNFTTYPASLNEKSAYVYFNAADWDDAYKQLTISHGLYRGCYDMSPLPNTTLYYANVSTDWADAVVIAFIGNKDNWNSANKWLNDMSLWANHYTGYLHYELGENSKTFLFSRSSGDANGAVLSYSHLGDESTSYTNLNETQTLNTVLKAAGEGTYSSANSKAAITMTSSELVAQGDVDEDEEELSTTENTQGITACRTAETVYSVGDVATGYQFDGFYDAANGGNRLDTEVAGTYTFNPTSATTVYARFSEKTFSVSFTNDGHGSVTAPAATPQTVGQITGVSVGASNSTGYHFSTWTISSGTGSFATAATTASNTFYPTSASTIRADFAPNTYTLTLNGNGGSGHTASVTATFDSNTLSTGITNPTQDGYVFQGWFSGEGGTGSMIINPSGVLQENVTVSSTQYTGASGIWKKAGDTNLYAKWLDVENAESTCWKNAEYQCGYITELAMPAPSATSWDDASWGGTPTINTKVVIPANTDITVDVDHAQAKEVILGSGSTLTVSADKGLEVAGTITDADGNALTASNLTLESSSSGNASLIFTNSNSTAAAVDMYSIAKNNSGTWYWQYVGIPFTGGTALDYFNDKYLYKFSGTSWSPVGGYDDVEPFVGYCFSQESAAKLSMSGTLVDNDDVDISLSDGQSKVFANSWTAPIYIGGFEIGETFNSEPATIYLFNTGSAAKGSSAGSKASAAGTYVAIPVNTAEYVGNPVIPSMQGFFIHATTGGTNTMKYDDLVRTTKNDHSVNAGAMYAPKRVKAENDPDVIKIWAESSTYSDKLVILAREDFSTGFDNGWDGEKKGIVSNAPAIYVLSENSDKDAVSAIPDFEGTVVGFKPATSETEYAVRFEYDGEETLYLNDQKAEESALIATGETYNFNANSEDNEARFVISRTPIKKITTSVENVVDGSHARKQMINGQLYIIRDGQIYDMLGKTIQ